MPHNAVAFSWMNDNVDIFKKWKPKSLLYVGWRHDTKSWWLDNFCKSLGVSRICVLEIFEKNLKDLSSRNYEGVENILGDVRSIDKLVKEKEWDIIFWDHGPEHLTSEEEFYETTKKIKSVVNKGLIYACPWGICPQGKSDGNKHEIHGLSVYEHHFKNCDINVATFNSKDSNASGELIGWWENNLD